jgi:hypothetical protein
MSNDEIARAIADALFVNGAGERADRLVLTKRVATGNEDLGGWCGDAVKRVVHRVLDQADQDSDAQLHATRLRLFITQPDDIATKSLPALADDVVDLVEHLGRQRDDARAVFDSTPTLARKLADELDQAVRYGRPTDTPEGSRYVSVSDTFAKQIAAALRSMGRRQPEPADVDGSLVPVLAQGSRVDIVARVAGAVFSRAAVATDDAYKQLDDPTRAIDWSVRIARQIVAEVERTEQGVE